MLGGDKASSNHAIGTPHGTPQGVRIPGSTQCCNWSFLGICWSGRRDSTRGIQLPKLALYQAELRPDRHGFYLQTALVRNPAALTAGSGPALPARMQLPLVFLDGPWKLAMGLNALDPADWLWRDEHFGAETAAAPPAPRRAAGGGAGPAAGGRGGRDRAHRHGPRPFSACRRHPVRSPTSPGWRRRISASCRSATTGSTR